MPPPLNRHDAHRTGLSHSLSLSHRGGIPFMRNRRQQQLLQPQEQPTQLIAAAEIDVRSMETRSEDNAPIKVAPSTVSLRSGTPHDRVLNSLIMRLKGSLPVHSRRNLALVEADDALGQTVASIVQLAKFRLDSVVWALAGLLDELNTSDSPRLAASSSGDSDSRLPPLDILQSQLFVLKVLSSAMAFRWQQSTASEQAARSTRNSTPVWTHSRDERSRQASSSTSASFPDPPPTARPSHSSHPARSFTQDDRSRQASSSSSGSHPLPSQLAGSGSSSWSHPSVMTSPLSLSRENPSSGVSLLYPHTSDPPQMDEQVAKYVLSTLLPYLRQSSPSSHAFGGTGSSPTSSIDYERPTNLSHLHSGSIPDSRPYIPLANPSQLFTMSAPSTPSLGTTTFHSPATSSPSAFLYPPAQHDNRSHTSVHSFPQPLPSPVLSSASDLLTPTSPALSSTPCGCLSIIYSYVSRIVFHMSASNWTTVYEKIQAKIRDVAGASEGGDMSEIELVSLSALNRDRLIQVLNDLSSLLIQMPPATQATISIALHSAILKWVMTYPYEFLAVIRGEVRLEGAPERVFDTLNVVESRNPKAFCPTLVMLLAISPDRLRGLTIGQYGRSGGKRNILDSLGKYLNSVGKQSDIAVACYIDLCSAAVRIPPMDEVSALRSLAPELADDLRTRLITPALPMKPFWHAHDAIDVQMYADALVAMFWFSHAYTVEQVLPKLLAPEQSYAVKMVAVSAMLRLLTEQQRLQHQPSLSKLYELASDRLPDIFHMLANPPGADDDEENVSVFYRPVMKRVEADGVSDHDSLLLAIIALWRADFRFLLTAGSPESQMAVVASVIHDSQVLLRTTLQRVITIVVTQLLIELGVHARMVIAPHYTVWQLGEAARVSSILCLMADRLLASHDSYDDERLILSTLQTFLANFRDEAASSVEDEEEGGRERTALNLVEIALVVALVSPQSDICVSAGSCLRLLAEADVVDRRRLDATACLSPADNVARISAYKQLGDPTVKVVGRQAQQKRIRGILRPIAFPSPINLAIWQEYHRKLASFSSSISWPTTENLVSQTPGTSSRHRPGKYASVEEERFDWQNTLNFLAAFGGCCLVEDPQMKSIAEFIPTADLPEQFLDMKQPDILLSTFISASVEILVRGGSAARNAAREALSSELDSKLYPILLAHLERLVLANFDKPTTESVEWDEDAITTMMQITTVLKHIFSKQQDEPWFASRSDLPRTLKLLGRFMETFNGSPDDILRAQLQYACLCEALLLKAESPLRQDRTLKQELLDSLSNWTFDLQPGRNLSTTTSLNKDVELACLRAIKTIAQDLPLQTGDGVCLLQEQSRLFYHYYRFFMGIVNRTLTPSTSIDLARVSGSSDVRIMLADKESTALRELALGGLANLMFANHQAAFRHCLVMTYHEDPRIRVAFLRIFREALDSNVTFDVQEELTPPSKNNILAEFIKDPNLLLIQAICEISSSSEEIDDLEPVLLHIFDNEESLTALAKALIDQEFHRAGQESELFRSNSLRNRMLSRIARDHSAAYLRRILSPLMQQVINLPPEISLEVDPFRIRPGENPVQNAEWLMRTTSAFLSSLEAVAPRVPTIIREISHHIGTVAPRIFHAKSIFPAVGGFIFLRCINPAISQPSTVGIEIDMTPRNQRVLLLITKIIQSLANNIQFGKEAYMTIFNDFLLDQINVVTKFLKDISSDPRKRPVNWSESPVRYADETDLLILHRFLSKHASALGQHLLTLHTQASSEQAEVFQNEGKRLWDQLVENLVEVGVPEAQGRISTPLDAHASHQEFMRRHTHGSLDAVAHLFVKTESPASLDNAAVFLFNAAQVKADIIDYDAFMQLVFKELMDEGRNFQVIVNMSSFAETSVIPVRWIKHFIDLTPLELLKRFRAVYFVHINRVAQAYLRRLYYILYGAGLEHVDIATLSVQDLKASFPLCPVLRAVVKQHSEPTVDFADVDQWDRFDSRQQCLFRVGVTHLRVETIKPQPVFPGLQSSLTEIIPFSELDDVVHVPSAVDGFFFSLVRKSVAGDVIRFSSKDGEAILRAIRKAKDAVPGSKIKEQSSNVDHLFNAGTTLLNVGLLNLCNRDDHVRVAALALVRSSSTRIGFQNGLSSEAFFVPANPHGTALRITDSIVKALPQIVGDLVKDFCANFSRLTTTEQIAALQYFRPCIRSLAAELGSQSTYLGRDKASLRARDCVRNLIRLTVTHQAVHGVMQGNIWIVVSQYEALGRIAVDEVVKAVLDDEIGSKKFEILADTFVVLASPYARGKIICRLQKLLTRATFRTSVPFTENAISNEIAVLSRLALILTSEVRFPIQVLVYLPELAHFVTLLAATGTDKMRTAIYGILLNLAQAIVTFRLEQNMDVSGMRDHIDRLQSSDTRRDFDVAETRFGGIEHAGGGSGADQIAPDALRRITGHLLEFIDAGAKTTGQANTWRARWVSLVVATSLRSPPRLQVRSFYVLGTLVATNPVVGAYVDDDLVHQILHTLAVSLTKPAIEGKHYCLASILDCMCKLLPALPIESKHPGNLFWLAVSLLQGGIPELYDALIELMRTVLNIFQNRGDFEGWSLSSWLLNARGSLSYDWQRLDEHTGLRFDEFFSVSLAYVISKAIRNASSQEAATALLYTLLLLTRSPHSNQASDSTVSPGALGYFIALIPVSSTPATALRLLRTARVGEGWWPKGLLESNSKQDGGTTPLLPFGMLGLMDHADALIASSFIVSMLNTARTDAEREILCHLLADAAGDFPVAVELIFEQLEKTTDTFYTSNNRSILEAVGTIFSVALARPSSRSSTSVGRFNDTDGHSRADTMNESLRQALDEYGMAGIMGSTPPTMLEYCASMTREFP